MPGRREKPEAALTEANLVCIVDRGMRELRARFGPEIDARPGALGQLQMAGDEVGVQMGLDDVLDSPALPGRRFHVEVDIALRIDDRGDALRPYHVRGMGEATQVEALDLYGFHVSPCVHGWTRRDSATIVAEFREGLLQLRQ